MKKIYLLSFLLLPVLAHSQSFYYSLQSIHSVNNVSLMDSINQSTDPANGPVVTVLNWSQDSSNFSHLETYCAPDASSGIEVRTHSTNTKVYTGTGNRFYNDSTYFEGTNGQSIPVNMYLSLDGELNFKVLSFTPNYCPSGADGSICNFVKINGTDVFTSCSLPEMERNRLFCLNCIFYDAEYTVNLLPKLLLADNTFVPLSAAAVDSLLSFYNSLTPTQLADNDLGMSANFLNFINNMSIPKSSYFIQPWVGYPGISVSASTSAYEAFERLIVYSGYYADWGLTGQQAGSAKLLIDYHLPYDLQDTIDLTATAEPFTFEYLFYSDLVSNGAGCETDVTSNFLNTFKIDSVRVQDGYFNSEVNFDSLFLVIAPGVRIAVKSDFQGTTGTGSPQSAFDVQVSPNPAGDFVRIRNRGAAIEHLTLRDVCGRVQYSTTTPVTGEHQIDLHHLPAGMYLLTLESAGHREVRKIVKR